MVLVGDSSADVAALFKQGESCTILLGTERIKLFSAPAAPGIGSFIPGENVGNKGAMEKLRMHLPLKHPSISFAEACQLTCGGFP
jgi:hypothetical protein